MNSCSRILLRRNAVFDLYTYFQIYFIRVVMSSQTFTPFTHGCVSVTPFWFYMDVPLVIQALIGKKKKTSTVLSLVTDSRFDNISIMQLTN